MPQLLLELFSEEIPARMQKRAEEDLAKLVTEKLRAGGLDPKAVRTFSSPRHLGLVIDQLEAKAADVREERKGPRVGAPDQALQGFLRGAGLSSIEQAEIVNDKKGDFYVARIERAGRVTPEILSEIVPEVIRAFPWPKSMRSQSSDLTWVRPLHNVLCMFDGAPVKIEIDGIGNEPVTWGHRFHAPKAIPVKNAEEHYAKLREAKVLIDREERRGIILEQAKKVCAERKLELVEDAGLLEEVTGLVEWPVVLLGRMDESFLDLPAEVIRLTMRTHQKYFAVRDPKTKKLAPYFITVANIEAKDGGDAIAAGNARVLSARLNDARFFWDVDCKTPLFTEERKAKLEKIVFHQKLGSVWDKVERVKALAVELCAVTKADPALVERAAMLMKCDLVTETVGEFPELQGQIGRELATLQGENASVATAVEDHYRPLGPNDRVPTDSVAVTLALADKLDTLVAFWAIDERPTGSSDAYGLRRAALGVCRLVGERGLRLSSGNWLWTGLLNLARGAKREAAAAFAARIRSKQPSEWKELDVFSLVEFGMISVYADDEDTVAKAIHILTVERDLSVESRNATIHFCLSDTVPNMLDWLSVVDFWDRRRLSGAELRNRDVPEGTPEAYVWPTYSDAVEGVVRFLADRLKVQLREQGKRHDLVDAVFALGDDDLVRIVARVEALDAFLKTEDGANLLAGYKRAANILAAEEKKGRGLSEQDAAGSVQAGLLKEDAEKALATALDKTAPAAQKAVAAEDFAGAMSALSSLRAPVDAFFDAVLVNSDDNLLRRNRLLLLRDIRDALNAVADFSKIEG